MSATVPTNVGVISGSQPTYSRSVCPSKARISGVRLSVISGILIERNVKRYCAKIDEIRIIENVHIFNNPTITKASFQRFYNVFVYMHTRAKQIAFFSRHFINVHLLSLRKELNRLGQQ